MLEVLGQNNTPDVEQATRLLWVTVGITVGLLIGLAIVVVLLVRHMRQVGTPARSRARSDPASRRRDGWTEAGRRLDVPPAKGKDPDGDDLSLMDDDDDV